MSYRLINNIRIILKRILISWWVLAFVGLILSFLWLIGLKTEFVSANWNELKGYVWEDLD